MDKIKIYYSMGDVAEMFDVNQSLIRYWSDEFSILKPERNAKGNRLFRQKDIDAFSLIYHLLKVKGMTIKGAKQFVAQRKLDDVSKDIAVVEKLESLKLLLQEVLIHFDDSEKADKVLFEAEDI